MRDCSLPFLSSIYFSVSLNNFALSFGMQLSSLDCTMILFVSGLCPYDPSLIHRTCKPVWTDSIKDPCLTFCHSTVTLVPTQLFQHSLTASFSSKNFFVFFLPFAVPSQHSFHRGLCWLVLRRYHKLLWGFTLGIYIYRHCFFPYKCSLSILTMITIISICFNYQVFC